MKRFSPRRLERFRAKKNKVTVAVAAGVGKAAAREAKATNIKVELAKQKVSGKLAQELNSLDVTALQAKLAEARKELFDFRFQHATGQLENVAAISAAKRNIARILTLIGQKEVGA